MVLSAKSTLTALLVVSLAACGRDNYQSAQPRTVQHTTAENAQPFVPAGTQFSVLLDDDLSTHDSEPGEEFTARVVSDVVASNGEVLIERGATVRGRIAGVDRSSGRPGLYLDFQTIETEEGTVPLQASVVDVPRHASVASAQLLNPAVGYDAILFPPNVNPNNAPAVGGGPADTTFGAPSGTAPVATNSGTSDFSVPEGAELRLQLVTAVMSPDVD